MLFRLIVAGAALALGKTTLVGEMIRAAGIQAE